MIRAVMRFLLQWVLCAFWGRKFWMAATKWVVLGLTWYVARKADEKIVLTASGQEIWSSSIGTLVTIAIVAVWLSVALGAAWAHFRRSVLRIEENLVGGNPYQVRVHNDGFGTSEAGMFVRRITDATGTDLDNTLPAEVRWEHHAGRPILSATVPAMASIGRFTFHDATNQHRFVITRINDGDYEVQGGVALLGQCWVEVVARDEQGTEASTWFLFDLDPGHQAVATGIPTFEDTWASRILRWLW